VGGDMAIMAGCGWNQSSPFRWEMVGFFRKIHNGNPWKPLDFVGKPSFPIDFTNPVISEPMTASPQAIWECPLGRLQVARFQFDLRASEFCEDMLTIC